MIQLMELTDKVLAENAIKAKEPQHPWHCGPCPWCVDQMRDMLGIAQSADVDAGRREM